MTTTKSASFGFFVGAAGAFLSLVTASDAAVLETWNDTTYADRLADPTFIDPFIRTSGGNYLRSETLYSSNDPGSVVDEVALDNRVLSFGRVAAQSDYGLNRAKGIVDAYTLAGDDQNVENAFSSSEWGATFTVNAPLGQVVPIVFNVSAEGTGYGDFTTEFTYRFTVARTSAGAVVTGEDQYAWLCLLECQPDSDVANVIFGYTGFRQETSAITLDLVGGATYQMWSFLHAGARTETVTEPVACGGDLLICSLSGLDAFNTAVFGPIQVPVGVNLGFSTPGFSVATVPAPAAVWLLGTALLAGFRVARRK